MCTPRSWLREADSYGSGSGTSKCLNRHSDTVASTTKECTPMKPRPSHKRRSSRQMSNTRGRQALAEKSTDASRRKMVQSLAEKPKDTSRRKMVQGSVNIPLDLPATSVNEPLELPSRSLMVPILELDFTLNTCSSEPDLSASSFGASTPHALTDSALQKSEQLLAEMLATIGVESLDRRRISICLSTDGQDDADTTDPQKPTSEIPTTIEVPIALLDKLTETWSKYREMTATAAELPANETDFANLERDLASLHHAASSCCSTGASTPLPSPSSLTSVSSLPQSQAASCNSPSSPISRMVPIVPCHFLFESPCRPDSNSAISLNENSKAANILQETNAPKIHRQLSVPANISALGFRTLSRSVLQGSMRAPTPSRRVSASDAALHDAVRAAQSPSRKELALHALRPPMPTQRSPTPVTPSRQVFASEAALQDTMRAAQSPSRKQLALHALQPPMPIQRSPTPVTPSRRAFASESASQDTMRAAQLPSRKQLGLHALQPPPPPIQLSPSQRSRTLRLVSRTTIDTYM